MPEIIDKIELEKLKKHILKKYKNDDDISKLIEQVKTGIVWEEKEKFSKKFWRKELKRTAKRKT